MPRDKVQTKRMVSVRWWRIIIGATLIIAGFPIAIAWYQSYNMVLAVLMIVMMVSGGTLLYTARHQGETGFKFNQNKGKGKDGKRYDGKENCINILAIHDADTGYDVPLLIQPCYVNKPKGRPHYIVNEKRHMYVQYNLTKDKRMLAATVRDRLWPSPGTFSLHAIAESYRDCIQFSPASMMQKVAPAILIGGMIIIGVIMVVLGGDAPATANQAPSSMLPVIQGVFYG